MRSLSDPAFRELFRTYHDFVWRSARRQGVPLAALDDVVQEVFLVAFRRRSQFEGRSSLKTWLYGITLNVVRTYQRSERRRGRRDGQALDPTTISAVADDTVYAEIELLDRLLLRLGPEQRSVFVLVVLEDVEPRDVADALQVSINTVYSRLRLARRRLRVAFAELGGQSEEGAGNGDEEA